MSLNISFFFIIPCNYLPSGATRISFLSLDRRTYKCICWHEHQSHK
jgi:hypothetical protein